MTNVVYRITWPQKSENDDRTISTSGHGPRLLGQFPQGRVEEFIHAKYNLRPMADIVIIHRVGTTRGHGGMYNRYDGVPLSWDERAITSSSGGRGNRSTGFQILIIHKILLEKTLWASSNGYRTVGFQDFRFDFARGYSAKYVKEYIEGSKPALCVGESIYNGCVLHSRAQRSKEDGSATIEWVAPSVIFVYGRTKM